jgi:hypothetical protein
VSPIGELPALLIIRDSRLYREQYGTFEEYCNEKWGMTSGRARQLIGASEVMDNLKSDTIVTLPTTESQARPFSLSVTLSYTANNSRPLKSTVKSGGG